MNYPTWKVRGTPTPNETLYVCDSCGEAEWGPAGLITHCGNGACRGKKGGQKRMRTATAKETAAAKKKITTVIG